MYILPGSCMDSLSCTYLLGFYTFRMLPHKIQVCIRTSNRLAIKFKLYLPNVEQILLTFGTQVLVPASLHGLWLLHKLTIVPHLKNYG